MHFVERTYRLTVSPGASYFLRQVLFRLNKRQVLGLQFLSTRPFNLHHIEISKAFLKQRPHLIKSKTKPEGNQYRSNKSIKMKENIQKKKEEKSIERDKETEKETKYGTK